MTMKLTTKALIILITMDTAKVLNTTKVIEDNKSVEVSNIDHNCKNRSKMNKMLPY